MTWPIPDGTRAVGGLTSCTRSGDGTVDLRELVAFDDRRRRWELVEEPAFVEEALREGLVEKEEVERWRSSLRQ